MLSKYSQGKIYKICDNTYSMTYYGSTIQPLCKRMSEHRSRYRRYKNGNYHFSSVFSIFEEFGVGECKIELVELFPCNSNIELHQKEGEYIRINKCVNKNIAGQMVKERRREYDKEYYKSHKEYYICDICGREILNRSKYNHIQTKLHQKALTDQTLEPEEEAAPDST